MDEPKRMNENQAEDVASPEQPARKPYEKPEIVYRAPLEAMASVCTTGGKALGGVGCTVVYS